jgi:hypothetical protein
MNGAATKATNRQIRKAFGAEALQYISDLELKITALERALEAEARLRTEADTFQLAKVGALKLAFGDFRQQPFWRRWLWALGVGGGR